MARSERERGAIRNPSSRRVRVQRRMRPGWGGRPVRQEQAQGILVAALGMLAAHYGYSETSLVARLQIGGFRRLPILQGHGLWPPSVGHQASSLSSEALWVKAGPPGVTCAYRVRPRDVTRMCACQRSASGSDSARTSEQKAPWCLRRGMERKLRANSSDSRCCGLALNDLSLSNPSKK